MPGYKKPMKGYANGGAPGMEQLDSIMMTGGPSDVPMGTPGMGGPPPGPPMGEDPMMALMDNETALGGGGMDRSMEAPMSIEEDAGALAEAVVGRAQGNIGAAVAILDTAKEMLMASGEEPMMANMGRPLMRRANGGAMSTQMPQQGGRTMSPSGFAGGNFAYTNRPPPPMPQESRVRRGPGFADGGSITTEEARKKLNEYRS
jgi:hypothetical protein